MYLLFCFVWTLFPRMYPVTTEILNFPGPITIVILLLALLDCFAAGKRRFDVPKPPYTIEIQERDNVKNASD